MKRKAILVGSPGRGESFLSGVKEDLKHLKKYLQSRRGGCFYDEEIVTLNDPTAKELSDTLKSSVCDYLLVYYTGHGFTDSLGGRRIVFPSFNIQDIQLLNESPRQLVIIDACRSYLPAIGSIPQVGDQFSYFTGNQERSLFDYYIKNSPQGKIILHATQNGKFSYDTSRGGIFTNSLLEASTKIRNGKQGFIAPIKSVLVHTKGILRENGGRQLPEITFESGDLKVPFALEAPYEEVKINKPEPTVVESSNNGWMGVAILGLVVVGAMAFGGKK